jgi:cell wall-associated NlpC family hydrolase
MTTWRQDTKTWLISNAGKVWYCWGAQDLYAEVADCSGLVIELLKRAGKLPVGFDATAQGLANRYPETIAPECGDLCVYGSGPSGITHVMIYVGALELGPAHWSECCAGMVGGNSTTTADIGRLIGAGLFFRPSPLYRNDFRGYRRVD